MATKYDVFEIIYKNRAPCRPIDVVKKLNKSSKDYHVVHRYFRELAKENLIIRKNGGFSAIISKKSELLYGLIFYCIRNSINYNLILDEGFARFVSHSLQKDEITFSDAQINPRTFKKYIEILDKYGLILLIWERPWRAKVFYNVLLNNLLIYFGYDHKVIISSKKSYILEIKKDIVLYRRLKKKSEAEYKKIIEEFQILFVYHSLSLEGNPVTLPDTIKILKENITPQNISMHDLEEVRNYQAAIRQMAKDAYEKKPLSLQAVLEYHKVAMRHKEHLAGSIRAIPVHIKGNPDFIVAKPEKIRHELEILFDKYNEFIKIRNPDIERILKFAVYLHNEFQHIHPFQDGNSRTTRLILFHFLQSLDMPVLDMPFGLLDEYLSATKSSKKREDAMLFSTLQKIILFNLKKIIRKLRG